jgi:DNA-binding MarR family transcriptional regulator
MVRFTDLFTEFVRVEIDVWNRLDDHLKATVGVTLPQFQALSAITATTGQVRIQEVSMAMSITVGAASKVVDRLERDGLARRSAHPTDRRSSLIALTPLGESTLNGAQLAAEMFLRDLTRDVLTEDRAVQFFGALTDFRSRSRVALA